MTDFDYAELDKRSFHNKHEKIERITQLGYTYITEAAHELYEADGPELAASKLGITKSGLYQILHYMGVKIKRIKGVRNNTKLTLEKARLARNIDNGRRDKKYIEAMITVLELDVSGTCLKAALNHETWRED